MRGTLAGEAIDERVATRHHAFINKLGDDPGSLTASSDDGLSLRLLFDQLLPNGRSTAARGSLTGAGFDVGNCEDGGNPGILSFDDSGRIASFTLSELREAPYCEGATVEGMLEGCVGFRDLGFD